MDTFAQKFLNHSGKEDDQRTVKFGSGEGPRLYKVCKNLNEVLVTFVLPSDNCPPITSVIHVGSHPKI
jgi:hypothetical protein